jgi:hypothetical protein
MQQDVIRCFVTVSGSRNNEVVMKAMLMCEPPTVNLALANHSLETISC